MLTEMKFERDQRLTLYTRFHTIHHPAKDSVLTQALRVPEAPAGVLKIKVSKAKNR